MKVADFPTSVSYGELEEHRSSGSQAVSSDNNLHKRPISVSPSDLLSQGNSFAAEKAGYADPEPSMTGSDSTYTDSKSNNGTSTPGTTSEPDVLPREEVRCSLLPNRSAAWSVQGKDTKLSTLAAAVLLHENILNVKELHPYHLPHIREDSFEPTDPISGVLSAAHGTVGGVLNGLADYPIEITKMLKEDKPLAKSMAVNFATDKNKGVSRIIGTGLRAPMDATMGLAKGFNNLPKAYGDDTVRDKDKITGVRSGLKSAGKGLGFGLYDGITGLVTQPIKGAQQGGMFGFAKGFGKGIGGLVCKPAAGACGVPAYAFKGIYEELKYNSGAGVDAHILDVLIAEGEQEWDTCGLQERDEIVRKWYETGTLLYEFHEGKYQ